jgi:hypothetical protein
MSGGMHDEPAQSGGGPFGPSSQSSTFSLNSCCKHSVDQNAQLIIPNCEVGVRHAKCALAQGSRPLKSKAFTGSFRAYR